MRRAARKTNGVILAGVISAFVVLAIIGVWFLGGFGDPFRGIEKISAESYMESAKSFQGGTYQFEGVVDGDLGFEANKGRLVSFRVASSKGPICLPALIPASMNRINPQKGQNYKLKVIGKERGLLVVQMMEKI
ncbi:MAG: hypothetical protein EBT30_03200 [Verrucomicrobia bacterium]|nr:hypothetical protein [Verrucomicrobiota bacterium]